MNSDWLHVATSASMPLPGTVRQTLQENKITVADHHRWRITGQPPQSDPDLDQLIVELRAIERNHLKREERR